MYKPWVPPAAATGPALPGPYAEIGPVVVCSECQHAHKKGPEGFPGVPRVRVRVPDPCRGNPGRRIGGRGGARQAVRAEPRRKLVSWREERRRGNVPRGERALLVVLPVVALAREETDTPPPVKESDEVIELRPPSDDPRGW